MNDTDERTSESASVQSTEVVALFPTFVWKTQLHDTAYRRINADIMSALSRLTEGVPELTPGAKWQTEQRLHELPEFAELDGIVTGATRGVLEFLKVVYTSVRITGCWANVSARGAKHKRHTHPNNYLSGVYYVQTEEGSDTITFDDPRPQTNVICPETREATEENAGQIHLGVREGLLVLFPSWLEHSVPENRSERDRISIAVNVMFERFGEEMSRPKWEGNVRIDRG